MTARVWILGAALAVTVSCTSKEVPVNFTESITLGGVVVSADVLNNGHEQYVQYCYACHGLRGKGDGPSARGLRPPPRDFTSGIYKFGKVAEGLPHDLDLIQIVKGGLAGTAMLPWDVPDQLVMPILQYIKTLAPAWQDPDEELGERILAENDPWADSPAEGIKRGKLMYHGFATCQQCHAAYATRQEIYEASSEVGNAGITDFRDGLYAPELKESDVMLGDHKLKILPPDFLFNVVRSGDSVGELFRTISAGVTPVMPAWIGSLEDKDIWAIAYYVRSLIEIKGTPKAFALQKMLANQPAFVAPDSDDGDDGDATAPVPAPAPAPPN